MDLLLRKSYAHSTSSERERKVFLATRSFARENRMKSWLHVIIVVWLIFCSYVNLILNTNLSILCGTSTVLSLLMVRLFVIYHDYVHKTILKRSLIAKIIFTFFGYYILAPVSIWNRSHHYHHRHNSKLNSPGIGDYPIITKSQYLNLSPRLRFLYLLQRHPLIILHGYFFTFMYGMCLRNVIYNLRRHPDSLTALVVHLATGSAIYLLGDPMLFIFAFFLPAFLSGCVGAYLFYVQHNYPNVIHYPDNNWSYFKAALTSSGYIQMNPVMKWFTGNIGFHHIHHLNAAIPFYNLPKAYRMIPELKKEKDTTLHPFDILRCLKLKVWDEAAQKMTGL